MAMILGMILPMTMKTSGVSNRWFPADSDNASDEAQGEGGRQGETTGLDPGSGHDDDDDDDDDYFSL